MVMFQSFLLCLPEGNEKIDSLHLSESIPSIFIISFSYHSPQSAVEIGWAWPGSDPRPGRDLEVNLRAIGCFFIHGVDAAPMVCQPRSNKPWFLKIREVFQIAKLVCN